MAKLAIQVKTTGEVTELDLTADSLSTLQTAVGGWVQAIDLSDTLSMWCNEEGKLISLPHNPYAQAMWDEVFGEQTDYLVGDVVFTGGTDDEGMTLGLDEVTAKKVLNSIAKTSQFVSPRITII